VKSKITILIIAIIYIFIVFNKRAYKENKVLEWDKMGYYIYLPAIFIYDDLNNFGFYDKYNQMYHFTPYGTSCGINKLSNGNCINKYTMGVSLLQLPFFFVGHILTFFDHSLPQDGFSEYYLLLLSLSGCFYVILGLIFLRLLLLDYFSESTVTFVLILIAFGTNLYEYTVFDYCMSHPYSFFLFSGTLLFSHKFYSNWKYCNIILASLFLGMIVITRPTNILILVAIIFWDIRDWLCLKYRVKQLNENKFKIVLGLLFFFMIISIQLCYWKYATRNWLYYSYGSERFNFLDPEILRGLFSYRKGWFVYTPLAFITLFGFIPTYNKHKIMTLGMVLFLCLHIYITFSWWQWYYGGGFGSRPMIEVTALLSFPLAILVDFIKKQKKYFYYTVKLILLFLTCLSVFQSYQYSLSIIPYDHVNEKYYWRVFGKISVTDVDKKLLD